MTFQVFRRVFLFSIAMAFVAVLVAPTVGATEGETPTVDETTITVDSTTTTASEATATETATAVAETTTTSAPTTTTTVPPTTTTTMPPVVLPPGGTFIDDTRLPEEGWIEAIAAVRVTRGCNPPANTKYCPEGTVTRGQMAAFIVRALKLPPTSTNYFIDDGATVYENDINRLAAAGITKGCNPPANDRFCPHRRTTRGEMAAFLVRAFKYRGTPDPGRFTDDDRSIFETDISRLEQAGITNGCGTNRYCPSNPMLRKHMAVFLGRALNLRPIDVPVQPDVIGSFTTYHPACRYPCRVTNIQLIADTVDDTVVQPGEIFSVNELVGQRTRTKGYVAAGAIIGGEIVCCDHPANIGGGTSQFATTLYNAAFFAGLEDIYHRPHSIWFSRYPMGREATLGYPGLDVKFRNNTGYALIIDTSHTSTSITVKIIGINDIKSVKSYRTGTATTSGGGYVKIRQLITFYDGSTENHYWSHRYNPLK